MSPSDITWPSLTRPYGAQRPSGRLHPPYDTYLVKRAITMGVDAGGNRLHVAMPRYQLTQAEAAALIAFLQGLEQRRDPGIGETSLRLGVLLPPAAAAPGLGEAIRAAVNAASSRANDAGGLYNRHLELRFLTPPSAPALRRQAVAEFLAQEQVFALVASFIVGADAEIADLADEVAVPIIGPYSIAPQTGFPINRQVFYLVTGFADQGRALVEFAARQAEPPVRRTVVVEPGEAILAEVASAIRDQAAQRGAAPWSTMAHVAYPPGRLDAEGLARQQRDAGVDSVFFLGSSAEATALLAAATELGWTPRVFLLGPLADQAIFDAAGRFPGQLFLAFPSLPSDTSPRAYANYRALATLHQLPPEHVASQLAAFAAFDLLVEALEHTGRELSRAKLIASLETFYELPSNFTPALTFGPNRRIGALGAYVVGVDRQAARPHSNGPWIPLQ